jgi:hypothetical protein
MPCLDVTLGERFSSTEVEGLLSLDLSLLQLNGIEMTSDSVNIFIFGFIQLFSGRETQIDKCKRTTRLSACSI